MRVIAANRKSAMQKSPRRNRKSRIEDLERRQLLTADLSIEVTPPAEFIPGEPAVVEIVVLNTGSTSQEANIASLTGDVLEQISWTQSSQLKTDFDSADAADGFGMTISRASNVSGFGNHVSSVGDINHDGIDDAMIAAFSKAYLLFGTANPPTDVATAALDGTDGFVLTDFDRRITSVASGGDVNGDGIDDLVLGAANAGNPSGSPTSSAEGRVYVVYGSDNGFAASLNVAELNATQGTTITGYVAENGYGSGIGYSVDIAEDINGDSIDDLIIGGFAGYDSRTDAVYIVHGATDLPSAIPVEGLDGVNGFAIYDSSRSEFGAYQYVGESVSGGGDLNGDGMGEIVFGSLNGILGVSGTPATANILFGTNQPRPAVIDVRNVNDADITRATYGYSPGSGEFSFTADAISLSDTGDINGDGRTDFLIGAGRASNFGIAEVGSAHVIYGNDEFPTDIDLAALTDEMGTSLRGTVFFERAGIDIQSAGDFDGDGKSDFIVKSQEQTWLIFGSSDSIPEVFAEKHLDGHAIRLGDASTAAGAGDFNADGLDDVIVGSSNNSYILWGHNRPDTTSQGSGDLAGTTTVQAGTRTVYRLSGVVRNDATDFGNVSAEMTYQDDVEGEVTESRSTTTPVRRDVDLQVAGTLVRDEEHTDAVSVRIDITNRGRVAATDSQVTGELDAVLVDAVWTRTVRNIAEDFATQDNLLNQTAPEDGIDLASLEGPTFAAGDVNGDGLNDLVDRGRLLLGVATTEQQPTATESVNFRSAESIVSRGKPAGDFNGDGLDDLLFQDGVSNYLIYGQSEFPAGQIELTTISNTDGFRIDATHINNIGDHDSDGFDDLAITYFNATRYTTSIIYGTDLPRSMIDPGNVTEWADTQIDWARGEFPLRDFRGITEPVTSAGDINADGNNDLLLGAATDFGGRAIIVMGTPERRDNLDLDDLPVDDAKVVQPRPRSAGSFRVAPVGDVDGDGFHDIALSYDGDVPADFSVSNLTIAFGNASPDEELETVNFTDGAAFAAFANLSSAGDVNFDGFDDLQAGSHILFGSADIRSLNGSVLDLVGEANSLSIPEGRIDLRDIGDFNGNGFSDFLSGRFLRFATLETEVFAGSGDIANALDIGAGTMVTYEITGTVRSNAQALSISLSPPTNRTELNEADNSWSQSLSSDPVVPGDADGDGFVTFGDFLTLSGNFGKPLPAREDGDFNEDGEIDFEDFLILSANFSEEVR